MKNPDAVITITIASPSGIILPSNYLSTSDYIQILIALVTLLAVLVALFKDRFWNWWDRPRISVSFDKISDRCYRWAEVTRDNIQDEGQHLHVKRQYFRLKVENKGGLVKRLRVRVDMFDSRNNEVERFEPSELLWISGKEQMELARGESEYVNFLSQVIYSPTQISNRLRVELHNASERGIAWDRKLTVYNFRLTVYGDNIKPQTHFARFTPRKEADKPGKLEIDS